MLRKLFSSSSSSAKADDNTAAEAKRSAEVLMQYADPAKNGIRLSMLALNALDVIGEYTEPHREAIADLARIDPKANGRMRNYANRLIDRILGESK